MTINDSLHDYIIANKPFKNRRMPSWYKEGDLIGVTV